MDRELLVANVVADDEVLTADVLRVGTELWLVPSWNLSLDGKWQTPARAIRIDLLPHQRPGAFGADLTLNATVPKAVLNGETTRAGAIQYEVETWPSIRLGQIPTRRVD